MGYWNLFKKPLDQVKHAEKWLTRGGMPDFCRFDDAHERIIIINQWLDAICFRDL